MSADSLEKFLAALATQPELKAELGDITEEEALFRRMAELGSAHGLDFSEDEVRAKVSGALARPHAELSDEDMTAVSGGAGGVINTTNILCKLWTLVLCPGA